MMSGIATLSDRLIFFLPVNTGFVTEGEPDNRFLEFYRSRSSPQLYCAIVGNIVVPGGFGSNAVTPALTTEPIWTNLAAAIREGGSLPGIQLATAWDGYIGSKRFVATEPREFIPWARQLIEHLGPESISSALNAFDLAADISTQHGFKHIQIHAAHGYLLSLLIDSRIHRNAGTVLERLAKLSEQLRRNGVQTSIRFSLRTGDLSFDGTGAADFHATIIKLPFDFFDLSSGFYNIDKRLIYPARADFLAARFEESLAIGLRYPTSSFILSGRAMRYDWSLIPSNIHPGLCRDIIANPKFLQETHDGCQNHNKCHYYSRGESHLTCARWV